MSLRLIAAVSKNGCLGKDGQLLWHIPGDQELFRELTQGNVVLMGRKTWESLPTNLRPLSGRTNVVLTRQTNYPLPPEVEQFNDLERAFEAHKNEEICVIGGGELYQATIDRADILSLTCIDEVVLGDTFFPVIDLTVWELVEQKVYPYFWHLTYRRRRK